MPGIIMVRIPYQELLTKAKRGSKKSLDLLSELIKSPTVVPRDKKGLQECADTLQGQFEDHGYKVMQFGSPAVVYAEKNVGAKKTLMCYHHYDVQTEGDLDLWKSSPWKMTVRAGRAFGRGAVDDKGPCVASLVGFDIIEEALGELPVNAKFVVEGEEEWSSDVLAQFEKRHGDLMKADGCVWETLSATHASTTEMFAGMKGDLSIRLSVGGSPEYPKYDAHSGSAGAIPSAPWRLVQALKTLKDEDDNITIDGVQKRIRKPTKEDIESLRNYKGNIGQKLKANYGLRRFLKNRNGISLLKALYLDPSLSINGLESGSLGEVHSTIVPAKAIAKLDLRLVPDMHANEMAELLRAHLNKRGFKDINVYAAGYDAAKTSLTNPFIKLVMEAAREVVSPAPANLLPMMSGTGPAYLFEKHTPFCIGFSYADIDKVYEHGPNENVPIHSMVNNSAFVATIAERLGDN
jgi:acetylornithine deacetylase/succinyl-diaminopimelate desuccinylase-like protein